MADNTHDNKIAKRAFLIAKILYTETGRENPIRVPELVECMASMGIDMCESVMYRYLNTINDSLFPVGHEHGYGYYRAGDIR